MSLQLKEGQIDIYRLPNMNGVVCHHRNTRRWRKERPPALGLFYVYRCCPMKKFLSILKSYKRPAHTLLNSSRGPIRTRPVAAKLINFPERAHTVAFHFLPGQNPYFVVRGDCRSHEKHERAGEERCAGGVRHSWVVWYTPLAGSAAGMLCGSDFPGYESSPVIREQISNNELRSYYSESLV